MKSYFSITSSNPVETSPTVTMEMKTVGLPSSAPHSQKSLYYVSSPSTVLSLVEYESDRIKYFNTGISVKYNLDINCEL